MKGWKKPESNSDKRIPLNQQKKSLQDNNITFNNFKSPKQLTPE